VHTALAQSLHGSSISQIQIVWKVRDAHASQGIDPCTGVDRGIQSWVRWRTELQGICGDSYKILSVEIPSNPIQRDHVIGRDDRAA
jgi:hypothetical protein